MRWRGMRIAGGCRDLAALPVPGLPQQRHPVDAWSPGATRALDAGLCATILNSTAPIFTFFLTLAITRHEAVTSRKLFGVVAGMAGICLIVGVQALAGFGEQLTAQIVTVLAAICYAGAAIFGRGFKDLDPMAPAAGSLLCGAAILIPLSLVVERPWTLAPSTSSMLALLGLAVFSTALAFVIYFRLIQTLGSVGTTAQAYLRVPIGVAVGVVFLGEQLSSTAWIGLACVVVGVAAMTIPARRRDRSGRPSEQASRQEGVDQRLVLVVDPAFAKAGRRARRTPAGARLRPSCRRARNARGPAARRVRDRP